MTKTLFLKVTSAVVFVLFLINLFNPGITQNARDVSNISITLLKSGKEIFGFNKEKRYLLVFQNTAEARGTGGIIGGYAVIKIKSGKLNLESAATSGFKAANVLPIKLPREYNELYNDDPSIWQNSNLSIHFPYGAKIWLELWKLQTGETLDGVIAVDPTLISYVLKSAGPIKMSDGMIINSSNIIKETLSNVYQKYRTNNDMRKLYLLEMINKTFLKIKLMSNTQKLKLIPSLLRGYQERRLLFYSSDLVVSKSISNLKSSGLLPLTKDNNYRAVIINTSGNKMDYYLRRRVEISSISCKINKTRIEVTIKNIASRDLKLSNYVAGRLDLGLANGINNSQGITLLIYGPYKSVVDQIINYTELINVTVGSERGRPVIVLPLEIEAKSEKTVTVDFIGGKGRLAYIDQPLAFKTQYAIHSNC